MTELNQQPTAQINAYFYQPRYNKDAAFFTHTDVVSATANVYMNFKLKRRDTGTADGESRGALLKCR